MTRFPQDSAAGLFLLGLAGVALWFSAELPAGTLRAMGPGMLPRALAILVGLSGILLLVASWLAPDSRLERWSLRGPIFVLGSIVLFAMTIRSLGLAVAGPLAVFVGAFASPEARVKESAVFAVVLTGVCILLFKVFLRLPIPVATFI
ncbi:MAG: tripartite tricarboxylate transporter TctB family protein [Alphaproteobacteria bacterium]|nr:tripartite tricarboxylate transporter TctB family protein [Alphaproteobacteria bacterium]